MTVFEYVARLANSSDTIHCTVYLLSCLML
jgi:hypothetical protein